MTEIPEHLRKRAEEARAKAAAAASEPAEAAAPVAAEATAPAASEADSKIPAHLLERAKAARANPVTYVTADEPPFLIMHGDKDQLVPVNQSELLEAALKKAGVEVTFHVVKGAGHGFGGPEITEKVRVFFTKHLRK